MPPGFARHAEPSDQEGSARPLNLVRSLVHALTAVVLVILVEVVLTPRQTMWASGGCAALLWTAELAGRIDRRLGERVHGLLEAILHPAERSRVRSSTWYATSLFAVSLLQSPIVASLAIVVLGFADPASGYVGRRFGRVHLVGGRTLTGSLAFVTVGFAAGVGVLLGFHAGEASWSQLLLAAGAAAIGGALGELFSFGLDDNLTIVLGAGGAASALAWYVGLS